MTKSRFKQAEIGMIPEDWEVKELGEICQLVKKQYSPSKRDVRTYIGLEHIEQQNLKLINIGSTEDIDSNKFEFKAGQILFGKLRPYFRKVYRPKFDGVCSTDIWVIDSKGQFDNGFLFYFLADQRIINEASNSSEGTRMPRARWDYLSRLKFAFPSIGEQRAIASVLGSLDDKIALNRSMNSTLEAIGQALFRRWFVELEFPNEEGKSYRSSGGEMVETELGEVPRGWKVGKYSDLVNVTTGKGLKRDEFVDDGNYSVMGANGELGKTNKYLFDENLILTGRVGTLGTVYIVRDKAWISDNVLISKAKSEELFYYSYYTIRNFDFESLNRGSTQPLITQTDLKNQVCVIPERKIVIDFNKILSSIFEKIFENGLQNRSLSQIRDSLLPKLMSGQIRVPAEL